MSALITQAYFNEQMATFGLKASFAPSSEALDTLILEASDWVENYCDRRFASQTVVDVVRPPYSPYVDNPWRYGGQRKLILDNFPVTAVASITWEDDNGQTGTDDPLFVRIIVGGMLEWKNIYNGPWRNDRLYTVTYTAGYATVPTNVQRAVALKIANLVQPQYQGPQEREVFMVTNLEAMIVDLLEPYRRERIG